MMLHSPPLIGYAGTTINDGILPTAIFGENTGAKAMTLTSALDLAPLA